MNVPVQHLSPPRHLSKPCSEPGEESDVLSTRPNDGKQRHSCFSLQEEGKHPNSHADNMSNKQLYPFIHPSPCLVLSGRNTGKQLPVLTQCHNRVKAILGNVCLQTLHFWKFTYPHRAGFLDLPPWSSTALKGPYFPLPSNTGVRAENVLLHTAGFSPPDAM